MESDNPQGEDTRVPLGMSLSDARALLFEAHNMPVSDTDPILLAVTLHQGFLADYEKMLNRHHLALTKMIGGAVKGLTEKALAENLAAHVQLADRISQEFTAQYRRAKILNLFSVISAAICIPVLAYLLMK